MIYRVELTSAARAEVVQLPPEAKKEIKEGLRFLARRPFASDPLRRELDGKYKLRVGR